LNGFQFTLSDPDLEFLGASSELIDISEEDYALFGDKMSMSWFELNDVVIHPNDIVFTIKAIARHKGSLQQTLQINSDITDAELYSVNDQIFTPKIVFRNTNEQLALFPVEPNPWSNNCHVPFRLMTASNVRLTVYSVEGSEVLSEEKFYSAGYHEIELDRKDLKQTGLLLYSLQNSTEIQSGKMIVTD